MLKKLLVCWRTICIYIPFLRPLLGFPTLVVFIRHAQSKNNKAYAGKLFLERHDQIAAEDRYPDHRIPLSKEGEQQALHSGPFLRMKFGQPDACIHSGHLRTRQTLRGIMGAYGDVHVPVLEDRRWREREAGHTYLMPRPDVEQNFPYQQPYWDLVGDYYARPAGGESLADVLEKRLVAAFADLYKRFAGKRVFIFTHGRVIQCARAYLDELSLEMIEGYLKTKEDDPKNCAIMVYRYSPKLGKLVLHEYNTVCWQQDSLFITDF
ncbi:hypothetical protein A3C09_03655 [Candidatus Uhrbacteria bacterium RIFCSPHIGHO2_02_FULL_47_44]|uniref:phosphoglycerate mutase (2,3-diphosphoglycerate-dependent) n=1 Tax=Candidatus Uhrbacteria bacterium RIFCSPLOWO2_02_FULL_48_18 TaxID=1802408 RepID=A0A1F7V778_9BACT|nr:MAG: hypothetical protein A2839_04805 [Candidatus Uhrbacteria bacterium RIFCSPHIGHO2_01_FULL_47_10]OGL71302.1 MAG: hypothetical protein A3C09_03655 [Candidatus Uhrbacteria bacterium RIFCSPHIGHO2_02_FULL_47_44]OGL80395.1 MAG: hypothetical protein A3B20_03200 [Candidatus Uhrbacteria bacterium RIFCSPLOWO2_01_FULL_47_17]OGL86255.1 MAG: hypothetical protein A3I41_01685 [Candidatus Uhrbacteria bacterium RIFCSPLOWO2_02_FULL_48_18]OGL91901.1 MAG: hypothetical protein A3H12_04280 [Candidatus Uhrbacte